MISLSVHLFNTIMIILLPTAFSFTQTAPFTNLQLDPPQPPLQNYHHLRSATTARLVLIQVLYTPAKWSTTLEDEVRKGEPEEDGGGGMKAVRRKRIRRSRAPRGLRAVRPSVCFGGFLGAGVEVYDHFLEQGELRYGHN